MQIVRSKFKEAFGTEKRFIENREEAAELLNNNIQRYQAKLATRIINRDSRYMLYSLIDIFDKVFDFYLTQTQSCQVLNIITY